MMVLPPRMMFCGPAIVARRDTLLPVSLVSICGVQDAQMREAHRFYELGLGVVDRCVHGRG